MNPIAIEVGLFSNPSSKSDHCSFRAFLTEEVLKRRIPSISPPFAINAYILAIERASPKPPNEGTPAFLKRKEFCSVGPKFFGKALQALLTGESGSFPALWIESAGFGIISAQRANFSSGTPK